MIFLLLTILLNTVLSAIMKLFPRFGLNALQVIVTNYWVCVITGSLFLGHFPINASSLHQPWTPWALLMGIGFICIFNLLAYSTKKDGITTTTVANKLSLVIPVLFSIWLYHEHASWLRWTGIVLAFPAVYLTTRVKEEHKENPSLLWPVLLFIGSGLLDTLVKYVEQGYLPTSDVQAAFTIHLFGVAAVAGTLLVSYLILTGKQTFAWKNVLGGIVLGVPNYFSIYFLIRMLNSNFIASSAAIPVNNIGIVVASTLMAIIFFREHVTGIRIAGLVLSLLSIILIAFS
ncbi:EamA family transporter [Chitinophagaceae bacterium MMS25-I14]